MARLERAQNALGVALVASGVLLMCLAAMQVPLDGAPVELDGQMGYAGWSGSAAIAARTQQLADEVEGGNQAADATPTDDLDASPADDVAGSKSPITMTVTSPAFATSVTTAQVVPTVKELIDKLEGTVTATEDKQLDEESAMKTFKEKQLDKIEELKEKNARLKRRCMLRRTHPVPCAAARSTCVAYMPFFSVDFLVIYRACFGRGVPGTRVCDENLSALARKNLRLEREAILEGRVQLVFQARMGRQDCKALRAERASLVPSGL